MILKRADFGKCEKSSQTPWNVSYMLANGFLTVPGLVGNDFVGISKGLKSTDFDQKAWAIAHGFQEGGFRKCEKSSQTPWNVSYMLANGILTVSGLVRKDFERISKGLKSTAFDQKAWAITHGFEEGGFR